MMVDGDATVSEGTFPLARQLEGGSPMVELPSYDAAVEWAARIAWLAAVRRRCGFRIRPFQPDLG